MMNSETGLRMRFWRLTCELALLALILSACRPAAPSPTHTPVTITVPTAAIVIVPPQPTLVPTPTPAPALPPGVASMVGTWVLNLNYRLTGYPIYSDIRYIGSLPLIVKPDGSLSGSGMLYTTLVQPPCNTHVSAGNGATVTLNGQIEINAPGPSSGSANAPPMADLTLTPQDPTGTQTFQLVCSDTALSDARTVSILWPALTAAGQLHVRFPFQQGIVLSGIHDVTAPSDGAVLGALAFQLRIGR
ncbi:MAG: hypothetical protein ACYDBJ_09685 [Aggregatilineales bacterium]